MTDDARKKRRGPKPEVFKVPLAFEDAVKAALETNPPPPEKKPGQAGGDPPGGIEPPT